MSSKCGVAVDFVECWSSCVGCCSTFCLSFSYWAAPSLGLELALTVAAEVGARVFFSGACG